MFFFFVGGVNQQVRQVLKSGVGRCTACGSRADLMEYKKVLNLSFIPIKRWPGKEPVMYCDDCKLFFSQSISPPPPPPSVEETWQPLVTDVLKCHNCSREVDPDFQFCPFCGSVLSNLNFIFRIL